MLLLINFVEEKFESEISDKGGLVVVCKKRKFIF
jgi:hypothetical protein